MKTAIVILNWNGYKMLETFLPTVVEYAAEDEKVVVADNCSTDDSLKLVAARFPEVEIIRLDKNYGFAEGYNRALKQIEAEYYVLLNSDVEVTPNWTKPLVAFMDNHIEAAACQPKLQSYNHRKAFEYAGASGGFIDRLGYPFCRGRIFDCVEDDAGQYDETIEVHWTTGACMVVRSKDYWEAGGLDSRFFAHNEEIDLCWRMRIMGRKMFCVPESHVYHVGGGTLSKDNPRKTFLNFRNNLTMVYKCLPDKELKSVMRIRWWLDYIAAWKALIIDRSVGNFCAIYRARRAFKKWKKAFSDDRKHIQQHVKKDDKQRFTAPLSILYQYYIKRKTTFQQLGL